MTTARCLLASLGSVLLLALACTSSKQLPRDAGSTPEDGPTSTGTGGVASGGTGGIDAGSSGDLGVLCPPCVGPPFPGCVGSGPCGCGPYTCRDGGADTDAGGADATAAPGTYSAMLLAGGLDRLVISKQDPARGLCFRLTLVKSASYPSIVPIQLPPPWHVERATVHRGAPSCDGLTAPSPGITATGGSGRISWIPTLGFPCPVDVDLTLSFPAEPGLPATELLFAQALRHQGCN